MKTCTICARAKPLSSFNRNAKSKDGHRGECRACQQAQFKAYKALKAPEHYGDDDARH